MTDYADLPTARTTLRARYVRVRLTCRSCLRARDADLHGLIASGRGDVPLVRLRWRCAHCGHRRVDAIVAPAETVLRAADQSSRRVIGADCGTLAKAW